MTAFCMHCDQRKKLKKEIFYAKYEYSDGHAAQMQFVISAAKKVCTFPHKLN